MTVLDEYKLVMEYLKEKPNVFSLNSKKIKKRFCENGIEDVSEELMDRFLNSRLEKKFSNGNTIPDDAVSKVMEIYYDTNANELERIKVEHQKSMLSENIVGDVLERYLASILKNYGWIWCSGEFIKAVDFIRRRGDDWTELQIKNRNTTENSSSVTVRNNTEIMKWFRSFSRASENRTSNTNWEDFPDENIPSGVLNESDFLDFLENYLVKVKNMPNLENLRRFELFPFIIKAVRLEDIIIYEDLDEIIMNVDNELLKNKILEKFKRNEFEKEWKRNQPAQSEIPNLNRRRKGVVRNPPSIENINNDLLVVNNKLPISQLLFFNEGILDNNDVTKCTIYPNKNQDMNEKVIVLQINRDDVSFYMFTNYDIWIPKGLQFERIDEKCTDLTEYYEVG